MSAAHGEAEIAATLAAADAANEDLSPGQAAEIDRVYRAYPHLADDAFVAEHRDAWLR